MTSSASTPAAARSPLATQGLGVAYATGAIISAQFGAALAKQLMGDLGPWGVVTLRLLTSSILLWAFFRPQIRSWTRQQWLTVIVLGVALTGANAFFYVAIEQVPLAIAVAIEFMGPLVLATVMSRRKLDLVWIALSFTGMAILTAESQAKPEDFALVGVFFAVLTAISRAAYILATEKVGALIPGMGGMVMGNVVSTLLVLPFPFLISGNNLLKVTQDVNLLAIGCLMGLLASAIAWCCPWSLRLRRLWVLWCLVRRPAWFVGLLFLCWWLRVSAFQFLMPVRRRRHWRRALWRITIATSLVRWMRTRWTSHRWRPVPLRFHRPSRLGPTARRRASR